MKRPINEQGVVAMFAKHDEELGFVLMEVQVRFPDATAYEIHTQQLLRVEFEYRAANFRLHGHDPAGCDLIVCWENDWKASPVAVLSLKERLADETDDVQAFIDGARMATRRTMSSIDQARTALNDEISGVQKLYSQLATHQKEVVAAMKFKKSLQRMVMPNAKLKPSRGKSWGCSACGQELGVLVSGDLRIPCNCGNVKIYHAVKVPHEYKQYVAE